MGIFLLWQSTRGALTAMKQQQHVEVVMTLNLNVTNWQLGRSIRRFLALVERADKSVPFDTLQMLHDGKLFPFVGGLHGRLWAPRIGRLMIGGVSKDALIEQVRAVRQLDYAEDMMRRNKFTTLPEPQVVWQIDLSPQELGFTESPLRDDLLNNDRLAAWSEVNLDGYVVELNPAEAGPHMAIQYTSQPKGEALWNGMRPTPDADGNSFVFCVERCDDGAAWLCGCWVGPGSRFDLDDRVSFRLREISASAV